MATHHPLDGIKLTVRNFKSFGEEGGSLGEIKPINIVIGRNNTGKSALIDVIELCISQGKTFDERRHQHKGKNFAITISQTLGESELKKVFDKNRGGDGVPGGNHWAYGKKFVGTSYVRNYRPPWQEEILEAPDLKDIHASYRGMFETRLQNATPFPFAGLNLLRVAAERDVVPEQRRTDTPTLGSNGDGTTNLIRAFLYNDYLPHAEVEQELLEAINVVYLGDSSFRRIFCQEGNDDWWEIFLREDEKGDIRLSQSGSSLKSVFIILSMLRLVPIIKTKIHPSKLIFSIEEPENNLHPALLRRLLTYLAAKREELGFTLFLTTHSPICIDWSSKRNDSQIIHVKHDGKSATSHPAINYLQGRDILDDLDIRASDILQANGVIWVEGPSDRIYLRRWIELVSNGELKEGVHYTIMFYGGRLLSHLDALPLEESEELISLLRINRNAAVVIDSDRQPKKVGKHKPRMNLNKTKIRVRDEIEAIGGFAWITEGREIENYTPLHVFARITGKPAPKTIDQYTKLPDHPFLSEFKKDKVAIAHAAAPATELNDIDSHLDLRNQLERLCAQIRDWNGLN